LCLLAAGCFSLDPLNKPPNMQVDCELPDGRSCSLDSAVQRGDRIRLHMAVSDPDGNEDPSSYGWQASACGKDNGSDCVDPFDAQHYDEQSGMGTEVAVPVTLPGDVRSISVDFEAHDDRGGIARQSLIRCLTGAPTLPSNADDACTARASRTMYLRSR
jgi:hypothetical protein